MNDKIEKKPRKSISLRGKIDPLLLNYITLGIIIIFVVGSIGATLNHADQVERLLDKQLELGDHAVKQNDAMIRIQKAQGNLSEDARAKIIASIIKNEQELIPAINRSLTSINQTLVEEIRDAAPQGNFTAQKIAVANIEELKDNMNIIKGSIISLDNKVNELFFLENKNTTPTR